MKNSIVITKAYETIEFMKVEKKNGSKSNPNALTASVTVIEESVNARKRMISFIDPAISVLIRGGDGFDDEDVEWNNFGGGVGAGGGGVEFNGGEGEWEEEKRDGDQMEGMGVEDSIC
ncbi:hypothetical protein L1987_61906 [Smallanthus sonchifolius]|uniref:Uncharacterized protein n=1 Tax=Smallanthus sonchifolius TaxID=185202 RepID=A0ACB9C8Y5_9ASTR|nr:hypothetical protein L1987_61906 [Smallanthus sonchifolius]